MKTAITVIEMKQVSMDEYRDFKTTKVFDDTNTIGEIKEWVIKQLKLKKDSSEIGLSGIDISDLVE